MKKTVAAIGALILAGTMTLTAFAQATEDHTIRPTGRTAAGDDFDVTPDPETADTDVTLLLDPGYIITIPTKVELQGTYGSVYSNTGTIKAEQVFLEEKQVINVDITSQTNFLLTTAAAGSTYELPYTAEGKFGAVAETGGRVASFVTDEEDQETVITFTTDEAPKYAGKYTDTVTFDISVAAAES